VKLGDKIEVKAGYMVGVAQPVQQRATGLTARVRFPGICSFSFVLFSYALHTSLCINVFAFCIFCISVKHSVFCTTYVLLFRIVHCWIYVPSIHHAYQV
jgi:hypothetical protein